MFLFLPSVNTSPHDAEPSRSSCCTDALTSSRWRTTLGCSMLTSLPSSLAKISTASSSLSCWASQRGDSGRIGKAMRMITRNTPWKAIGHLHAKEEGSAWLLARPINVLSGWPKAINALWMMRSACSHHQRELLWSANCIYLPLDYGSWSSQLARQARWLCWSHCQLRSRFWQLSTARSPLQMSAKRFRLPWSSIPTWYYLSAHNDQQSGMPRLRLWNNQCHR